MRRLVVTFWVCVLLVAVVCSHADAQLLLGDVNGDGVVNAVDVQLVINAALGIEIGADFNPDINGDSVINAVDVQLVINAALGILIEPPGTVSGTYDPVNGLHLATQGLQLAMPGGALSAPVQVTMKRATPGDLPAPVPGSAGLAGGVFGPSGLTFLVDADAGVTLQSPAIARALPVLTYDDVRGRWVGTGANASVDADGVTAAFALSHFSIVGVSEGIPIPDPGDAPGSFVVLSNNGNLDTEEISSSEAALIYSEFGSSFSISAISQTVTMEGDIDTKALGLTAVAVFIVENYVVGVVGGPASLFSAGGTPEPAVGVMIMSVQGQEVSMSIYVATGERVIFGTLTGTM